MVYSAGEKSELRLLQKTQTHPHFRICQMSWSVWVKTCHTIGILGNTARNFPYRVQTAMVIVLEQMKRTETETVDEHYTEGKPTCTEVSKLHVRC